LSAEEKLAISKCRFAAAQTIEDIASQGKSNLISGWNGVWLCYQAAFVPLVSLFTDLSNPEETDKWRNQVEKAIDYFTKMEKYSVAAKSSAEVVSRLLESSRVAAEEVDARQKQHEALKEVMMEHEQLVQQQRSQHNVEHNRRNHQYPSQTVTVDQLPEVKLQSPPSQYHTPQPQHTASPPQHQIVKQQSQQTPQMAHIPLQQQNHQIHQQSQQQIVQRAHPPPPPPPPPPPQLHHITSHPLQLNGLLLHNLTTDNLHSPHSSPVDPLSGSMSPASYGGLPGVLTPAHSVSSHGQMAPQTPQLTTPADFLHFGQPRPQSGIVPMCGTHPGVHMATHHGQQHPHGGTNGAQLHFWDDMMWDTLEPPETTGHEFSIHPDTNRSWSGGANPNDGGAQWQYARENNWSRQQ
jgi:hypothetical protein